MNKKAVTFTGHRPNKFSFKYNEKDKDCIKLKNLLREEIERLINNEYNYFISGMALGVDTWAAEIVLELKKKYPHIKLEAAIPCYKQESRWIEESKVRYNNILASADVKTYVVKDTFTNSPNCMLIRNVYMMNNADHLIAVYMGGRGGTKHAFDYANKLGLDITRINKELDVSYIKAKERLEGGILECSSQGDPRFSALNAYIDVFGRTDFIEDHYQLSKRFINKKPRNKWEFKGETPSHFVLGNEELDIKYLSQWYKLLWCKYLDHNPDLVEYLKRFDDYSDKFKGRAINSQADAISQYIKEGRQSILKESKELLEKIK